MNRKDVLKREYEDKVQRGGFGTPRSEDNRRGPVRRRWKGKAFGVFVLLAVGILGWHERERLMELFSSSKTPGVIPSVADGKPANGNADRKVTVGEVRSYLTPSLAEVEQLYSYVVKSPFLAENLQYRQRMDVVDFAYLATNDTVNAFGGRRVVEKNGEKQLAFHTVLFGGAARYARLVALAAAMEDCGRKGMLKKLVTTMPRSFCGRCGENECIKFIAKSGLADAFRDDKIRQRAMSYSSGTIVSVLAHESGHHALGHLLSVSAKKNLEIERNQEREADSFASSIISASPFGEYIFAGTLFWHYAIAAQADGASDRTSDHPLSRERFENFVRANAEKAAAMGITVK